MVHAARSSGPKMNSRSWNEGAGGNTWGEGSLLAFLLLLLQHVHEGNTVLFIPVL